MDKSFFISRCVPGLATIEWALIRNKRYNAVNQRCWLEYQPTLEVADPYRNCCTHIIRLLAWSASYVVAKGLRLFSQWVRFTNADTFIVGPFDFSPINGRKSKDRVPVKQ